MGAEVPLLLLSLLLLWLSLLSLLLLLLLLLLVLQRVRAIRRRPPVLWPECSCCCYCCCRCCCCCCCCCRCCGRSVASTEREDLQVLGVLKPKSHEKIEEAWIFITF